MAKPLSPQYSGGIVVNPELNDGLHGWTAFGDAKVEHAEAIDGNKYIVASSRNQSSQSFSQEFELDKEKLYTISGTSFFSFKNLNYKINSSSLIHKTSVTNGFDIDLAAWLQVSNGSADIAAVFKTANGSITAGWVAAHEGCWSMLKGGLVVNASGPALLHFEVPFFLFFFFWQVIM